MKKKFILFIFLIFLLPFSVLAEDNTDKLYINIDISEDGSLLVKELAVLNSDYNGRLRTIDFMNPTAHHFTGSPLDFGGSDIYNATSIKAVKVYDVSGRGSITFDSMSNLNQQFRQVTNASSGEYGVYTLDYTSTGIDLKIFNPSSHNSSFYIEYKVTDAVVVHNDVAELGWNILGSNYEENVNDMEVRVNLPKNDSTMRVWAHGPLNGEINRTSDKTATLKYNFLGAYNPVDIRMMFDKSLVPYATKLTNVFGKDNILAYEKSKAEEANRERDAIKLQNNIIKGSTIGWYILLIGTIIFVYIKYDREHKTNFTMQYYREIPGQYGPEILEYLLKKNITTDGFSASILEIIRKKALKVEEVPNKKKDYKFIKVSEQMNTLTDNEQSIVSLLIDEIGNGQEVTLNQVKSYGNNYKKAESFISQYNDWLGNAKDLGSEQDFYQSSVAPKVIGVLISMLGWLLFILNLVFETNFLLGYLALLVGIIAFVYFVSFKKKTEKGALEYQQWMAFKRFLLDFGRMDEKTLPEITLWEKYLVYATVLGCAKQLEKDMKIRIAQMDTTDPRYNSMTDFYIIHSLTHTNIASTIASTVHSAVESSRSSIAASQSSSSGGFGGGVSSGGGSFGGGGGGGRF